MNILIKQITEYNNLCWAWEKAKFCFKPGDIWFNELEVSLFEANLKDELLSIQTDIRNNNYKLRPIMPMAYPKGKNEHGPRTRQTFWISVRDQVAWLATVNILGREIDSQMPFWSYGNRLYISVFKNEITDAWNFGYYRNTTRNIYRKWSQSWPLYRRHINLTAKILSRKSEDIATLEIDEIEESLIETNNRFSKDHPLKVNYLETNYWNINFDGNLFWAGVDLEKFYPRVRQEVIKDNFKKYVPRHYDDSVSLLITSLLDFVIDYSNWTSTEVVSIGLEGKPEEFKHIPTGLFVGGFLANVALLQVDKIINEKLIEKKNIAHFRYVDDHVILSNSFDDLLNWITEYKKILDENHIGTTFNLEKTEPKTLSEYYKYLESPVNEEDKDDRELKLEIIKKKAKSDSKLDPEFPSPLMTQTLTKVSKLSKTNINLLAPSEEKSLVADIEHLLVTEFPDQELRRDTRVSFAARMLSILVPELTQDINEKYKLLGRLIQVEEKVNKYTAESKELMKGQKRKSLEDRVLSLKKEQNEINFLIKAEDKKIDANEELIARRTMKMLLKSIRENHEKVRLWARVFEFCLNSGIADVRKILEETIGLVEKEETNKLSITFINSSILHTISSLLIKSFSIIESNTYSQKKKKRAKQFLENILTEHTFTYFENNISDQKKEYETVSLDILKFTAGTILFLLKGKIFLNYRKKSEYLIAHFKLINWNKSPTQFTKQTSYDFSIWAWWILTKLPKRDLEFKPYLWDQIITHLKISGTLDKVIIQLYPTFISESILNKIDTLKKSNGFINNEGVLFEIYKSQNKEGKEHSFLNSIKEKTKKCEHFISLCDWIDWTKVQQKRSNSTHDNLVVFDPRLGEWAALEILTWVADLVKAKVENVTIFSIHEKFDYSQCIHPNNFLIPSDLIRVADQLSWEKLRNLFSENRPKMIFRREEELIKDYRFASSSTHYSSDKIQDSLNGLAAILICLLGKNYNLPANWNPIGHQNAWANLYRMKIKDVAISSYTRNIIDGCYSQKNKESRIIKPLLNEIDFEIDDDTAGDPPEFRDIKDFIEYIRICQKQLEIQQISVASHQPRQLTPISLKQLRRNNYQENFQED